MFHFMLCNCCVCGDDISAQSSMDLESSMALGNINNSKTSKQPNVQLIGQISAESNSAIKNIELSSHYSQNNSNKFESTTQQQVTLENFESSTTPSNPWFFLFPMFFILTSKDGYN